LQQFLAALPRQDGPELPQPEHHLLLDVASSGAAVMQSRQVHSSRFTDSEPSAELGPEHRGVPERSSLSTAALLRKLIDELSRLFRHEVALARSELTELLQRVRAGFTRLATGAALMFVSLLTLVAAAVLALAQVMPAWLAALGVGLLIGMVGFGALRGSRRNLDPTALKPRRIPESLRQDAAVLARKRR
jgi:hypothetical protein